MTLMRMFSRSLGLAAVLCVIPVLAVPARAQAWTPSPGEGTIAVVFQTAEVEKHYFGTVRADRGHINSRSVAIDFSLGLTRKFAVDVALPYVMAKYNGPEPHPTQFSDGTLVDNGRFHGTPQDFRFAARYNLTSNGIVITPYAALGMPSHDYVYFAHSAPGIGLKEFQVGTYVAALLDNVLPGAFIQGRYSYGFLEQVQNIAHNRSQAELELGYFFTPSFRAFAIGSAQVTHGGMDMPFPGSTPGLPVELRPYHDQIGRFNHLNVGGGAAFSLSDSMDVFGSFVRTVAARNGHELNYSVSTGLSFSIGRKKPKPVDPAVPDASGPAPESTSAGPAGSLYRCVCQKGM